MSVSVSPYSSHIIYVCHYSASEVLSASVCVVKYTARAETYLDKNFELWMC